MTEQKKQGRIYKLVGGGKTYYGSTIQTLEKRFNNHKRENKADRCGITSREIIECEDCKIELVEEVEFDDIDELLLLESKYIKENDCVNKRRAKLTEEELVDYRKKQYQKNKDREAENAKIYYEKNKEKILAYTKIKMKDYRQKNKEKIKEKRSEKIRCEICDCEFLKVNILRHNKTKKHQKNK